MPIIQCACGKKDCDTAIKIGDTSDKSHPSIWLRDKTGQETLMYLDANAVTQCIREFTRMLKEMTIPDE
jgi:hypothetical protein